MLHEWVNYTGCDSLYSAAADANAAYFAGHERFSMNANDCDALGPGGYNAPGMEGLDPANGNLYVSADGSVGYYSRDRGLGADDELLTSAGLWIASDNLDGSQNCGGVHEPVRHLLPALQLGSSPDRGRVFAQAKTRLRLVDDRWFTRSTGSPDERSSATLVAARTAALQTVAVVW